MPPKRGVRRRRSTSEYSDRDSGSGSGSGSESGSVRPAQRRRITRNTTTTTATATNMQPSARGPPSRAGQRRPAATTQPSSRANASPSRTGQRRPTTTTNTTNTTTTTQTTSRANALPSRAGQRRPRPLPTLRRQGYAATYTTRRYPAPTLPAGYTQRIEALRNQLRHPYAILDATLRWHLIRADWDVNGAAASFRRANSATDPVPPPSTSTARNRNAPPGPVVRGGSTLEHSRLIAIHDVGNFLRHSRGVAPSNVALLQMFLEQEWDVNRVVDAAGRRLDTVVKKEDEDDVMSKGRIEQRIGDRGMRAGEIRAADTMTSALDGAGAGAGVGDEEVQAMKDERLAWFISATATESWYSARQALERAGWNVVRAIEDWLRNAGIPHITPSTDYPDRGMRGVDLNAMPLQLPSARGVSQKIPRALDVRTLAFTGGFTASLPGPNPSSTHANTSTTQQSIPRGYLIDEDRRPARVNCPDASKLRVGAIRNGEYKISWFNGQCQVGKKTLKFRWDDTTPAAAGNTAEFDWSNPSHITRLNRWREEAMRRLTRELLREAVVPFNKYEMDWLREQEAMRHERIFGVIASKFPPDATADVIRAFNRQLRSQPFATPDAELKDLTNRFNATFAGKTSYQKVKDMGDGNPSMCIKHFDEPRPTRSSGVIQTQRTRTRLLCRHFMRPLNNPHGPAPDVSLGKEEEDSDFEEERREVEAQEAQFGGGDGDDSALYSEDESD